MSKKLAHKQRECKYHIVWIPKCRRKVVYGKLRKDIGEIIRRLCDYRGLEIAEAKACIDHLHLFVSIPPKYSVSSIVGYRHRSPIISWVSIVTGDEGT